MIETTGVEHTLQFYRDDFGNGLKLMAVLDELGDEFDRKAVTETLIDGDILVVDVALGQADAVGAIHGVRLFAGEDAEVGVPESGVSFATMAPDPPVVKDDEEEITISFEVQVIPA